MMRCVPTLPFLSSEGELFGLSLRASNEGFSESTYLSLQGSGRGCP
jgi:hypothetical protein